MIGVLPVPEGRSILPAGHNGLASRTGRSNNGFAREDIGMRRILTAAAAAALFASPAWAADFTLTSPEITTGSQLPAKQVFNGFGCTGGNVSPALTWSGAPAETKSFAVTV